MNTAESTAQRARLLIIDDEPAHMTALYHTLEDEGYDVTAFTSAHQALEALHRHSFDLVLTDLKMPEMDGIQLLRQAQEVDSNLVGIVMTGHGAIETAIEAMKAGALDYVLKPFKLSSILPVIYRALEVRRLRFEIAELQQRVREHVVELEAANKELETFSYSVSHDLRAPLRAISGFSNILAESYAPHLPDDARQLLKKIMLSAERMGELIEHLLRFARLSRQSLVKRPVVVRTLVQEVLDDLHKENGERQVEVRVGELPDTVGDPVLLRQVFFNLLSNAFKFTRNKLDAQIEVGSEQQGDERIYFVRDNGAGFDMQYAANLFRVFYRLHNSSEFEGTGVGLSLVQRIVQRHGGRIWAEAKPNEGAAFFFTLPSQA